MVDTRRWRPSAVRAAAVLSVVALVGCGPVIVEPETQQSASSGGTTTASSSGETTESTSGTTLGSESGDSSTTGTPIVGPGCDPPPACDRGTLEGSVSVSSVDEIANIAGYTSITGSVLLYDSEFVCVDFLSCLTMVGENVDIYSNKRLRDISGTDAIVEVGSHDRALGSVYLSDNDEMVTLDGFASLSSVRKLVIQDHAAVERISGFEMLEHVETELFVFVNPVLHDLGRIGELRGPSETCWIAHNPKVCQSAAEAVCGVRDTVEDNDAAC